MTDTTTGDDLPDWARPLGDIDRARELLGLAVELLGRAAGSASTGQGPNAATVTIGADLATGELRAPPINGTLRLGRLAQDLAGLPHDRWPPVVEAFLSCATSQGTVIGALRLDHWVDVRPRLLPRLVADAEAGPLAQTLGAGLALDLAIDIGGGIVRTTVDRVAAWGRDRDEIWAAARANHLRLPSPTVRRWCAGPLHATILIGPWVGGVVMDLPRFVPELPAGPAWLTAPSPGIVAVIAGDRASADGRPDAHRRAAEMADRLAHGAALTTGARFAPNLYPLDGRRFPGDPGPG